MYFLALATDYDGTLAKDGIVDEPTLAALRRLKESGRRLVLVTGRELPDLRRVFPELHLCDLVVAENGALLFEPGTDGETPLASPPPERFVARLRELGVEPLSVGRSIVATWEPMETVVLETVREQGLELQIIFNKGAVMVLPPGINKASGLRAALDELRLSPHNVVGAGDAENDHAFLALCGCSVAVANALPAIKEMADLVTRASRGAGVAELIDQLLESDLRQVVQASARHRIGIGTAEDGSEVELDPMMGGLLVAGVSGGGKSTKVAGILERLADQGFQYCVIDPEGDYAELEGAVVLGDAKQVPRAAEAMEILNQPGNNLILNLLGVELADRPTFLAGFLPQLCRLRAETGRPHWIVIDEAHHMLPSSRSFTTAPLPSELPGSIIVTVHPDQVAPEALDTVELVFAVGKDPAGTLRQFCAAIEETPPVLRDDLALEPGEALLWHRGDAGPLRKVAIVGPRQERQRHTRKYAVGELGPDRSFYFKGPDGALNLRAQNFALFNQIAAGIDDATWLHHLQAGDYSAWVRDAVKDEELAREIAAIEGDAGLKPKDSREQIIEAISRRYTAPASASPASE